MAQVIDNQSSKNASLNAASYDFLLLGSFSISAFSTLWLPGSSWTKLLLAFVLIVWAAVEFKQTKLTLEFANQRNKLTASSRRLEVVWIVLFTCLAAVAMYSLGVYFGAYRNNPQDAIFDKTTIEWLWVKFPTVIAQQVFLHLLLMPLLVRLCQSVAVSVWISGVVFAALHLPNPGLMVLTFVGGTFWLASYQRSKRMLPLVGSHLILAVLAAAFGGEYLLNMRVGKSCVELFPAAIESDFGTQWEFPCSSVGCTERMMQTSSSLKVEGWAHDSVHAETPQAMAIRYGGKLFKIESATFSLTDSSGFSQTEAAGFVGDTCYSFNAEIPLEILPDEQAFELFICNQNQHWAKLGALGELKKCPAPARQTVVLFPVEVDGRVESIEQQGGGLLITGWAADLRKNNIAERIVVADGVEMQTFELEPSQRLKRPGIAAAYSEAAFTESGFQLKLPRTEGKRLQGLRFYAADDAEQLHRLSFTATAARQSKSLATPDVGRDGKLIR